MAKQHFSYTDVINKIANANWGQNYESADEAAKDIISKPATVSAMATMELLKRLNSLSSPSVSASEQTAKLIYMPENPDVFPDAKIGDVLFSCDMDEGLTEEIVIAKDAEGHCVTICKLEVDDITKVNLKQYVQIAHRCFRTKPEAIRAAALREIGWLQEPLKKAESALKAVENGEEFDGFDE